MTSFRRFLRAATTLFLSLLAALSFAAKAEEPDASSIVRHIDAAASARYANVLGFTVTEHYAVFRGKDEIHPAAEMTVETTYRKGAGKSYNVLSHSGSEIVRKLVLNPLLDREKTINLPGNVERSWFTSANYEMKLMPGLTRSINGQACLAVAIAPKRKAPNLIDGTLWVNAKDDLIVQIEGTASESPSVFAGRTQMMRRYTTVNGFAMSLHGRAESDSLLFGRTIVTIDYRDYRIDLLPPR